MINTGQDEEAKVVVREAEPDQEQLAMVERLETIEGVKRGIQDVNEGKTKPLAQVDAEMREKHGIPR